MENASKNETTGWGGEQRTGDGDSGGGFSTATRSFVDHTKSKADLPGYSRGRQSPTNSHMENASVEVSVRQIEYSACQRAELYSTLLCPD